MAASPGELSPHLVIVFSTAALVGPVERFPAHYRFVGPSISDRPESTEFPFDQLRRPWRAALDGHGHAEASGRFYQTAIAALAGRAEAARRAGRTARARARRAE